MAPALAASEQTGTLVEEILRSRLFPSPSNPRKHFDDAKLQELAESIVQRGIRQPLRVRPVGERFEIVYGERRYRAAGLAGLEKVPCIVDELTDLEVLEDQLVENGQRDDITALEESDAYHQLQQLDPRYQELSALAARVSKSVRTVRERLRLRALIPSVREELEADRITLGHAELLARLSEKDQAAGLRECFYEMWRGDGGAKELELRPVKDLQTWINSHVAIEPTSSAAAELFPEMAGQVAKAQAAGGSFVRLSSSWQSPKVKKGDPVILGTEQWREAKASDKCAVTGVVVLGHERGSVKPVCVDKTCAKHFPHSASYQAPASKPRTEAERKREADRKKREDAAREREKAKRARWGAVVARALGIVGDEALDLATLTVPILRRLVVREAESRDFDPSGPIPALLKDKFGVTYDRGGYNPDPKSLAKVPDEQLAALLTVLVLANESFSDKQFAAAIAPFRIDLKKLDATIQAEEKAAAKQKAADAKASPAKSTKKAKKGQRS